MKKIMVDDFDIDVVKSGIWDYFSLNQMIRAKLGTCKVGDWLRTKATLEMLFVWETRHNPTFNWCEFAAIMECTTRPGRNDFYISVKEWVLRTKAVGLFAWTGMYGGTYGQKEIALEFAGWVAPSFRVSFEEALKAQAEEEIRRLQNNWQQ